MQTAFNLRCYGHYDISETEAWRRRAFPRERSRGSPGKASPAWLRPTIGYNGVATARTAGITITRTADVDHPPWDARSCDRKGDQKANLGLNPAIDKEGHQWSSPNSARSAGGVHQIVELANARWRSRMSARAMEHLKKSQGRRGEDQAHAEGAASSPTIASRRSQAPRHKEILTVEHAVHQPSSLIVTGR
jgi:hypothetical protein